MKYINTLEEAEQLVGRIDNKVAVSIIKEVTILTYCYNLDDLRKNENEGGSIIILENASEMENVKRAFVHLNTIPPEYEERIKSHDGKEYLHSLYIYSNDYAISVYHLY